MNKILSFLRSFFLFLFDFLAQSACVKNIPRSGCTLIVRVDNIGDFVLWLPSAKYLLPELQNDRLLVLVCNETCVELAEATGNFSRVIGVDVRRFVRDWAYRWKLIRQVGQLGAAIAIQPTYSRVFLTGDSLIRASRADQRVGSSGDHSNMRPWQKVISNQWYTYLVLASPEPLMELERNAEFLRGIGIQRAKAEFPSIRRLSNLPSNKRVTNEYFVLFPGASADVRRWPLDSFAAVGKHVLDKYGWVPVICGGSDERSLSEKLVCLLADSRPVNLTGNLNLPELAEILGGARLVVSNETSAIHIAAGVDVPSVCILGGGHYGRFMPYPSYLTGVMPVSVIQPMSCFGCNWRCKWMDDKSGPYPCVRSIEVEQVIAGINKAIAGGDEDSSVDSASSN